MKNAHSPKEQVRFHGIDFEGRPVFLSLEYKKNFFGSTDILFDSDATEEEVLSKISAEDLVVFGNKFQCEPMGTRDGAPLEIVRKGDNG